jgi:hypothetical protein
MAPRPEAEAELLEESIGLFRGGMATGRKMLLEGPLLRIVRKTRTDWAPFYWAPKNLWSKWSHAIDLMVDTGVTHLVVTQPVGPLSQTHATIVRTTGDQTYRLFLMSRTCNFGKHEVRHEFLYLPDCSMALKGRFFFLMQVKFINNLDSDGMASLKVRGPEAKILTLTVAQEEE